VLSDPDVFAQVVAAAESLEKKEYFTGGNAALMGQHLVETANGNPRRVRLVSAVGPKLKALLHPDIEVPEEHLVETDEIHLILEYSLGEKWGDFTAKRANRFIFSHDRTNAEIRPLDNFATALKGFDVRCI
jgi:ADP-dependent glucokinase